MHQFHEEEVRQTLQKTGSYWVEKHSMT